MKISFYFFILWSFIICFYIFFDILCFLQTMSNTSSSYIQYQIYISKLIFPLRLVALSLKSNDFLDE